MYQGQLCNVCLYVVTNNCERKCKILFSVFQRKNSQINLNLFRHTLKPQHNIVTGYSQHTSGSAWHLYDISPLHLVLNTPGAHYFSIHLSNSTTLNSNFLIYIGLSKALTQHFSVHLGLSPTLKRSFVSTHMLHLNLQ